MLKKILQIAFLLLSLQTARGQQADSSSVEIGVQVFLVPNFLQGNLPDLPNGDLDNETLRRNFGVGVEGFFRLFSNYQLRTSLGFGIDQAKSHEIRTFGIEGTREVWLDAKKNVIQGSVGLVRQIRWGTIGAKVGPQLSYFFSREVYQEKFIDDTNPDRRFENFTQIRWPVNHVFGFGPYLELEVWLSKKITFAGQLNPQFVFGFSKGSVEFETSRSTTPQGLGPNDTYTISSEADHRSFGLLPLLPAFSVRFRL